MQRDKAKARRFGSKRRHGAGQRVPAAVRTAIQYSCEGVRALCSRYGLNPKTIRRWRDRDDIASRKPGPRAPVTTALRPLAEAMVVCFRRFAMLSLDDCHHLLSSASLTISRASIYRCLKRYGLSRCSPAHAVASSTGWFDIHVVTLPGKNQIYCVFVAIEGQSGYVILDIYPDVRDGCANFLRQIQNDAPLTIRGICIESEALPPQAQRAIGRACSAAAMPVRKIVGRWPGHALFLRQPVVDAIHEQIEAVGLVAARNAVGSFLNHFNDHCRLKSRAGLTPAGHIERVSAASAAALPAYQPRQSGLGGKDKRDLILHFSRELLSSAGPDGLSLSEVARSAGVSRRTVYHHFKSRAALIGAVAEWGSEQLTRAIFNVRADPRQVTSPEHRILQVQRRIANFAIRNPNVCQAWLLQILSMPDPSKDRFWREYYSRSVNFHETPAAAQDADPEVLSVIMLAGAFLWPVWVKSKSRGVANMQQHADRFVREFSRLALHGAVRGPEIA
jgi:AcrR family transcriptional regulator